MKSRPILGYIAAGLCAGATTGLFGAGGGMVLVPLLSLLTDLEDRSVFASSVAIILPICLTSLLLGAREPIPWLEALPYLLGSIAGGVLAGIFGKKIPTLWLHRFLGAIVLWGGIRYLC